MKNLLLCSLIGTALFCAADDLVYSTGFEPGEGFTLGPVVGQCGWDVKDNRHSSDAVSDVTNRTELVQSGSQALTMRSVQLEGSESTERAFVGVNFDIEGGLENKYLVFSGDFLNPAGKDNWVKLNFADTREYAVIVAYNREGYHSVKLGYTDLLAGTSHKEEKVAEIPDETWCHYELVVDPTHKTIISCTVGEGILTNTATRMMGYYKNDSSKDPTPNRIALEADLSADNLKIETRTAEYKPASFMLSKTGLYIDSEKNSAEFNINNTGSDPFDFTVSADESPEWLAIEPTSGSCSASQKITLSVDREKLTGDGYHKTLLTVNAGAAGSKKMYVGVASGKILMEENFEEPYMLPGEISGQGGWAGRKDDSYGKAYNEMIVTNVSFGIDGSCARIIRAGGYDGYTCPAKADKGCCVKVSLKLYAGSEHDCERFAIKEAYWSNCAQFEFKREEGRLYLYKFNDANKNALAGDYSAPLDTWIDFSFTMDYTSYVLKSVTFGNLTTNYAEGFALWGRPNDRVDPVERYETFAIGAGGSSTVDANIFIDDLRIEQTEREIDDGKLAVSTDTIYAERTSDSVTFQVRNTGTTSFDYTVSAEDAPEWLNIEPASGSCVSPQTVTLSFNRSIMTNGYYRTFVTVDAGDAGTKQIYLAVPNGTVVMYEDFEAPYMTPGEVTGQGLWNGKKDDGYGQPYNEMIVTNVDFGYEGACAHLFRGTGWDGYTLKAKCDKQALVKVSMMLYFGTEADTDSFYIRENYWGNCAQFQFKRHEDHFNLYKLNEGEKYALVGEHAEFLDEWVPFSFTLDYRAYKLTSVTFGDETVDFPEGVALWNAPNDRVKPVERYEYFAMTAGGEETVDAMVYIDNIKVEQIDRPAVAAPIWTSVISVGEEQSSITNRIDNLGSVDFNYDLRFVGQTKGLSADPASGTISQSGNAIVKLDRSVIDDGFFRTYLIMDYKAVDGVNSGSITSFVTYCQGGWFYTTEFEGMTYKPGFVNGQDTWSAYTWGTAAPSITVFNGLQCLYFPYDSTATSTMLVPAEVPYRTSLRFYLEKNDNPYELDLCAKNTKIGKDGNLRFCVVYEPKDNKAVVGYKNYGDDEVYELCEAPMEQWNELSFILDTDVTRCCADSLTLNDFTTNFYEGQVVLDPSYDSAVLDQFFISAYCLIEDDHAGVYVDNLVVCDRSVPEPLCAALIMSLIALLAVRKR
ncbi:BACON domain-containing protein [bacterium]|nr:BACON domain-containing protein [bacterium]